jgi:hypothetical protein
MKQLRYAPRGTKMINWTKLSPNAVHNALLKLYPNSPDLRISEKERILAEREALRVERITKDSHATLWTAMIRQLEIALNTPLARVRRAKQVMDNARGTPYEAETGEAQERLDAYRAYVALLEKLLDKLRYHRDTAGKTPMQLAKEKNIPNGGRHWADWLPEEIKRRFHIAFDGLGEVRPLALFPDTVFAVTTKKRKVCPSDTLKPPGTVIEQIRDKLRAADKAAMLNPTPENLALRDTLILAREEAIRDKNRANVRKYAQVRRTAMQEWKVKHMAALEKLRLPKE